MKIENQNSSNIVVEGGEAKKGTINQSKIAKLQYILTEGLYSDATSATIVELTNNAMDSIIESGKDPIENPVIVELSSSSYGSYKLSIKDNGIGMDKEFFENVFMSMLSSTKEDSDDQIGHFGIGGKAWASLRRTVNFTIIKDGRKCKYLCYKGVEFIEYDLLSEEDTTEENGVLFEMPIISYSEYDSFKTKSKKKLAYYDTVVLIIDGKPWDNKIYRSDTFQWCTNTPYQQLHLCLKDVVYQIDWDKLGYPAISFPIALRFGLKDSLVPSPSRETILMSKETIQLIKDRIKEVADWFVAKFNSEAKEFETMAEAYDRIDRRTKNLNLQGTDFDINGINSYSLLTAEEVKIKEMKLRSPSWYKGHLAELLYEYIISAYDDYGKKWRTKSLYWEFQNEVVKKTPKVVVFNKTLTGNIKEYLRSKHGIYTVYVTKERKMSLKSKYHGTTTYSGVLLLTSDKKKDWRAHIDEFNVIRDSLTSRFVDETNAEDTPDFKAWLDEKRERQRLERKSGNYSGGKPILDKDRKTEITIGTARKMKWKDEVTFDKRTRKVSELHKHPGLSVYRFEKDMEVIDDLSVSDIRARIFNWTQAFPTVDFIVVNPSEEKHVKEVHNYINEKEFYMTKPFSRLFTALMIKRLLERIPSGKVQYITDMYPKWSTLHTKLEKYRDDELKQYRGFVDIEQIILNEGKSNNSWDTSIQGKYNEMEEIVKQFYFLKLLQDDSYYTTPERTADKKRLVASMLLFQKRNMDGYELIPKAPVEVLEQMCIDSEGELVDCEQLETV